MVILALFSGWGFIQAAPLPQPMQSMTLVGSGTLDYAIWKVYTASLYTPTGEWKSDHAMGLHIHYHIQLDGKKIAERSIHEMKEQGMPHREKWGKWKYQLKTIIPSVKANTHLSAIYIPGSGTQFYKGDQWIGSIPGDDFGVSFFGIWLNEGTSEPKLRRHLLGKR